MWVRLPGHSRTIRSGAVSKVQDASHGGALTLYFFDQKMYSKTMVEGPSCNICRSPWHQATGHYISKTMRWCGPCTKSWVRELCGNQYRRWGGYRFYDHARVPPAAVEKVFIFTLLELVPGEKCTYMPREVKESGVILEEALARLKVTYPWHQIAPHLRGLWREEGKDHETAIIA